MMIQSHGVVAQVALIEGFEEATLASWNQTGGTWTVQTDRAWRGLQSVSGRSGNFDGAGDRTWDYIYRGNYERPQRITGRMYLKSEVALTVNYGVVILASAAGGYMLRVAPDTPRVTISLLDSTGGQTNLAVDDTAILPATYEWLECDLRIDASGNMVGTLRDEIGNVLSSLAATDATLTSGGYGIAAAQGDDPVALSGGDPTARIDHLRFTR